MSSFSFDYFRGKTIGFFGLGKSNTDILSRLPSNCNVILRSDVRIDDLPFTKAHIKSVHSEREAFEHPQENILIFSPSVRRNRAEFNSFKKKGVKFTSDCELFFENAQAPIFAVSGSDGKSTVSTLAAMLLSERFIGTIPIGNIGVPMLSSLDGNRQAYVTELSSFMLSYGKYRVFRGVITNINENHLDWHDSFEEYAEKKLSLFNRSEEAVLNADDPILAKRFINTSPWAVTSSRLSFRELKKLFRAQAFYTWEDGCIKRNGESLIRLEEIKRREQHNIQNLIFALALTDGYTSRENIVNVASKFGGLEHRCELFLTKDGMDFINSSVDSTPIRTARTLESLDRQVIVILGGRSKKLSYQPLKEALKKWAKRAIICGECADEIEEAVKGSCPITREDNPESAAICAKKFMESGDTLLLSPASTSFDRYKSYEQRGKIFKEVIHSVWGY